MLIPFYFYDDLMHMIKKNILAILMLCVGAFALQAKVVPAPVFADGMVLQQQTEAALWGIAKPNSKVVITTTWSKSKNVVNSDDDGKWSARISTPVAGGPYEITFNDGEKHTLKNVLIGEVWICSGQSNMEMPLKGFEAQPVAVRYAWSRWCPSTLFNCSDIPVTPFNSTVR